MSRSTLVVGGNRGIGAAIGAGLAAAGHRVTVTHRGGHAPDGPPAVHCDVTDPASIDRAFAAVESAQGPVEVLVVNAGITRDRLLPSATDTDLDQVIDTNLSGALRTVRRAARGMLAGRWGRIILVSSVNATSGAPGQVAYAASKAAHIGAVRSLSWELGGRGITANVVAPGFIDTDMTRDLTPDRRREYLRLTPAGRFGTTAEVAAVVRFLAGDDAGFVTGAVIPVSGGLGMGH